MRTCPKALQCDKHTQRNAQKGGKKSGQSRNLQGCPHDEVHIPIEAEHQRQRIVK